MHTLSIYRLNLTLVKTKFWFFFMKYHKNIYDNIMKKLKPLFYYFFYLSFYG